MRKLVLLEEVIGAKGPEEERQDGWPNRLVAPMFAQCVCRIKLPIEVRHDESLGGDGFTDVMEGKGIVTLVKLGVRDGRAVDDGLFVTKYIPGKATIEAKR